MKKLISMLAILAMLLAVFACAVGEETVEEVLEAVETGIEEAEAAEIEEAVEEALEEADGEAVEEPGLRRLRLGSSVYTLMIADDFVAGELTGADIAAGQIGCWQNDETGLDMDVFQIAKDDASPELSHFALRQADAEEAVDMVWPADKIGEIDAAWYWARNTVDGEEHVSIVYLLDSGDSFLKLAFRPADEDGSSEVWDIMDSLDYMELKQIPLGTSSFTLTVPDDYKQGEISDEDIADDQVAYWYSDASLLDFDVYQFSKEGLSPTLAEYVVEESSTYPAVTELVTDGEINLIPVAWYRAVDECEEGEYNTITYIFENGDEYIDVVFWLDGPTAEAEADFIIHNLIDESMAE